MGNVLKPLREDPLSFAYEPLLSPPIDPENENLRVFSLTELKKATKNFRQDRVVNGEDGSVRTFYKGSIDDTSSRTNTRISVSVMECVQDSLEAIEAWKMFPSTEKEVLSWATRVKIAIGIAQGVAFLHSVKNSSLYFELRMHNIMLDEEYNAKLFYLESDKKCLENCLSLYRGRKYMPHECLLSGVFKMDSDVFAFGVILLELFTDSKDGDLLIAHLTALRNEAKKLKNKSLDVRTTPFLFTEIIDPRLEGDYPVNAAMQMGTLIRKCTRKKSHIRPVMQKVLDVLIHIAEIN
ncbi:hypothetical protein Bca101_012109 [Brassica carinata]